MNDHPLYSCDDHLDIGNVPRDVWTSRVPEKYRDVAPRVVERGGVHLWMVGDRPIGVSGRYEERLTALGRRPELEDPDGLRPAIPKLRLEDMESDGIHASIVYGAGALTGFPIPDPEAVKPDGYDDIPAEIPDPEAEQPEDWDAEEDGEWEPCVDSVWCDRRARPTPSSSPSSRVPYAAEAAF